MRMQWHACADIVLAGDSRIFVGVSPAEMSRHLDGLRVRSYAFGAVGYSSEYLGAVEGVLDLQSHAPTVVLGITPHSLTQGAVARNDYVDTVRKGRFQRFMDAKLWRFQRWLSPIPGSSILRNWFPGRVKHVYQEYFPDGWVAIEQRPENPREALSGHKRMFVDSKVSAEIVDAVTDAVARWVRAGIRVYAFRPPTTAEMVALEQELSGFDETAFIVEFQRAGGSWIEVDQTGYHSYDGSHLCRGAAVRLSRALALRIGALEVERPRHPGDRADEQQ